MKQIVTGDKEEFMEDVHAILLILHSSIRLD